MVLLVTKGFAQNPIEHINANGINKKNMLYLIPIVSPSAPITRGTMAPPAIPLHNIPDKDPWCSLTELRSKEKIIEYITEIENPTNGKKISAIWAEPKRAKLKNKMVKKVLKINSFLLSIIFNNNNPRTQPIVSMAQKGKVNLILGMGVLFQSFRLEFFGDLTASFTGSNEPVIMILGIFKCLDTR